MDKIKPSEIHAALAEVLKPNEISHWYSDLYCKVTPASCAIIDQYEYRNLVTTFIDNIDHVLWYEIPFCYNPNL